MKSIYHTLLRWFPAYRTDLVSMKDRYLRMRYQLFKDVTRLTLDKKLCRLLDIHTRGSVLEVAPRFLSYKKYMHFDSYKTLDINPGPGIDHVMDLHHSTLPEDSFDVIVMTEVLEHLHTPLEAVQQIRPALTSGGKVIATTRFAYPYHEEPHDYFRFTEYGLREVFKEYSRVEIITHGSRPLVIWQFITSYRILRILVLLDRLMCLLFDARSDNAKDPLGFIVVATK